MTNYISDRRRAMTQTRPLGSTITAVVCDFVEAAFAAQDISTLSLLGTKLHQDLSTCVLSYFLVPHPQDITGLKARPVLQIGFSPRWDRFYKTYLTTRHDPLVQYGFEVNRRFSWHEFALAGANDTDTVNYVHEVATHGVRYGYGLPVFNMHGQSGFFMIGFRDGTPKLTETEANLLEWAAQTFHFRYLTLKAEQAG